MYIQAKGAFFVMVQALEEIIAKSSSIVFFGGAGVSTESGIPDFRSVDGLIIRSTPTRRKPS